MMMKDVPSRFTISVDDDTYNRIEEFRFEGRYKNRNDAINELLKLGFEAVTKEEAEKNGGVLRPREKV